MLCSAQKVCLLLGEECAGLRKPGVSKYTNFTAVAAFNSHFCPTKDKVLKKRTKYPRPAQIRGNERVCDELGIATSSSDAYVGSIPAVACTVCGRLLAHVTSRVSKEKERVPKDESPPTCDAQERKEGGEIDALIRAPFLPTLSLSEF